MARSFWGRQLQVELTGMRRALFSFALIFAGLGVIALLDKITGYYFASILVTVAIVFGIYGSLRLNLFLIAVMALVADYFFVPPIGSVLTDLKSLEHFLFVVLLCGSISALVSELRGEYREMMWARLEAERAAIAMEKVLALVTHDIRNPLTSCKMAAELILRLPGTADRVPQLTGRIIEGLSRADSMIQTLLDVSRIRAGHGIALRFEFCDLASILSKVAQDMTGDYGSRIVLRTAGPAPGYWSEEGIRRAVENLVTNAVKYGAHERPIEISLLSRGDFAVISVHNEGGAIPKAEQEKLFESFFRTQSAVSAGPKGWGLGLELVKGIAEAHTGKIRVESSPTAGTTFFLEFPVGGKAMSVGFQGRESGTG
jgi:signal transduction histidine kinase